MQLDPRDRLIGRVLNNNHFLVLPGVRVKTLASRLPRLAAGRIADDRAMACGIRPVLVQSFTGPQQSGLGYRAAGLVRIDLERGRMGGTGIRTQPAPRRAGPAADCTDGHRLVPPSRPAPGASCPAER